jgi:hypothetical protein
MKSTKTVLATLLAIAALVAALTPSTASAKAKPAKVTLYLHGNTPIGEAAELVSNTTDSTTMVMDTTEPSGPAPKSFGVFQPFNESCVGNPLFPSWLGTFKGTIVGPIKLTAHFAAPPTQVRVRLWNDVPFSSCTSGAAGTDAYVDPPFEEVIDVPAGHNAVEFVFPNKKLKVLGNLVFEISQASQTSQGRVLYDAPDTASSLEFNATK